MSEQHERTLSFIFERMQKVLFSVFGMGTGEKWAGAHFARGCRYFDSPAGEENIKQPEQRL